MGDEQIFAAIFDYGADANIRASRAPPNINALCSLGFVKPQERLREATTKAPCGNDEGSVWQRRGLREALV